MAFCKKCGAELEAGAKFCPKCGEAANNGGNKNDFSKIVDMPDSTSEYSAEDISKNKIISLFSYIWILFLVPMFAAKDSKFARFHANQGLVLFIIETAAVILQKVCAVVFGPIFLLGALLGIAFWLVDILTLALAIIGIINAVQGKAKRLPVIGKINILK